MRSENKGKIAMFWKRMDSVVKCSLCYRMCTIKEGKRGFCGVRINRNGTLYSLVYGKITAANIDPIEKKPLFHFHPGSSTFSISTVGCNFRCQFCCNWVLSQETEIIGREVSPETIVEWALKYGANGISYTYNEPTVFYEFAYDTAKIAHSKNLYNTFVTNGYLTPEAIREIAPYLDAATVDFKGSGDAEFYRKFMSVPDPSPIYESLLELKRNKIFTEVTNLVVPQVGDDPDNLRKLARWIVENLGPETPFHLIRFYPEYKMLDFNPTPISTLEKLASIAKSEGLQYVYIGNVPGHELENTYCPSCGELLIARYGFTIHKWNVKDDNRCPKCGEKINIIGGYSGARTSWLSII